MLRTLYIATAVWLGVHWIYVAVMHAKAVMARSSLSLYWKVHLFPLAIIGFALDIAFNVLFGTLMFREIPKELLFSSRVQRHVRNGQTKRLGLAMFWAKQLNAFDPDHIKL